MNISTVAVTIGLCCFPRGVVQADEIPLYVSPALGLASSRPDLSVMERPFEMPLPVKVSGTTEGDVILVQHCAQLLALPGPIVGSDNDASLRVVYSELVTCQALNLLMTAAPAQHTACPSSLPSERATRVYPASLWPSISPDEEKVRRHTNLRRASGVRSWDVVGEEDLHLSAKGVDLGLEVLARGDFNQDGWEDLALYWRASLPAGTWADSRLVVLTRTDPEATYRELSVVLSPR